jgi:hypothetical protein
MGTEVGGPFLNGVNVNGGGTGGSVTLAAIRAAMVFATPLAGTTGWTITQPATGTGTIAGESLVVAIPSGSGVSVCDATYVPTWPVGTTGFAVQGRVQLASADTQVGIFARVFLNWNLSGGPGVGDKPYTKFELLPNGDCNLQIAGSGTPVFTAPLNGTLWWRQEVVGNKVRFYTGTGSGDTQPTTWIYRGEVTLAGTIIGLGTPNILVSAGMEVGGPTTSTITATYRDITISVLQ